MNLSVKQIALLFSFASAILTTACDEPEEIGLPQGQSLGVSVTENVLLNTSTVLVDSVATYGASYMLAGRYQDPKLGPVTATGYFQPVYNGNFTVENPTRADSAVLILPYNSYYYGDTTASFTLSVHSLQDSIRAKAYYSFEQLPYELEPVGAATFTPGRDTTRTVRVKLAAAVADRLLSFANKPESEFLRSFPGFALVGNHESNNLILGFSAGTTPRLRLYFQTATAQTFDFLLTDNARFNQISGDRTRSVLSGLSSPYSSVSAAATGGETYVQGGTGLVTRIEFPDLANSPQLSNVAINRAELVVTPLPGNMISSRSQLILYEVTGDGRLLRNAIGNPVFTPGDVRVLVPTPLLAGYSNNAFTFNVTRYVADVLQKKRGNNGLYLSLPSFYDRQLSQLITPATSLEQSLNTLYLGGHSHPTAPVKLRIYYTPITAN